MNPDNSRIKRADSIHILALIPAELDRGAPAIAALPAIDESGDHRQIRTLSDAIKTRLPIGANRTRALGSNDKDKSFTRLG